MVIITYYCDGCDAKAETQGHLKSKFQGVNGRSWGFGAWTEETEHNAPEGWVIFDPYTACTYCEVCWSSIELGTDEARG